MNSQKTFIKGEIMHRGSPFMGGWWRVKRGDTGKRKPPLPLWAAEGGWFILVVRG
ncbi:hypothetical protein MHA01_02850 [Marinococcus halophilus]|uniref:Uncharacterized protein n=1 Tax=Marinococcus halophilus TaxID=1371 RepID=A0A510Y238_MARHA|nr:hypothetical protein MHA01_02850 [Marinococcus halophilus]